MRILKTKKNIFIIIINLAIFTGIIIGFLVATILNGGNKNKVELSIVKDINTFVVGNYSEEKDKNIANINIEQDLKKKYNIDVLSGRSATAAAKSVEASSLYDPEITYDILDELAGCLSKYPNSIFFEIQNQGYNISIYLVDGFENDNIALATRDSNNSFNIYISNSNVIEKSIHHEIYHILEYYMKLEADINVIYKSWNSFNPKNFEYNEDLTKLTNEYVYNVNIDNRGAYFITRYSKSADKEDRAETFADMMLINSTPTYYEEGEKIGEKAKSISNALENNFNCIKEIQNNVYWARFI